MKITKISLTNFRAFKQTQTIDFAPVTLLFGPNSVGKSTVLKALFYVQQILEKGQCNPMYLDALNKKYIGGFENLVHKRDLDTNITLKIEYDKGDAIGSSYAYLYELLSEELDIQLSSPIIDARTIAVEFEIAWHKFERTAYIKTYRVEFDGDVIAEVTSSGPKQAFLTFLNYIHPLLLPANHDEWLQAQKDSEANLHPYNRLILDGVDVYETEEEDEDDLEFDRKLCAHYSKLLEKADDPKEKKNIAIEYFAERLKYRMNKYGIKPEDIAGDNLSIQFSSNDYFVSALHELVNSQDRDRRNMISIRDHQDYDLLHNILSIDTEIGALPKIGKKVRTNLDLETVKHNEIITELLSDVLVAPLDNLLNLLNSSLCIGPIRKIPDANYQPLPYIEQSDWYDGSAAWSMLKKASFTELKKIHDWMSNEDKLNLGYGISAKLSKTFNFQKSISEVESFKNLSSEMDEAIRWQLSDKRINDMNMVLDRISMIENRVIDPNNEEESKLDFEHKTIIKKYRKLEKKEENLKSILTEIKAKNDFEKNSEDLESLALLNDLDKDSDLSNIIKGREYHEIILELEIELRKIEAQRLEILATTEFLNLDVNDSVNEEYRI